MSYLKSNNYSNVFKNRVIIYYNITKDKEIYKIFGINRSTLFDWIKKNKNGTLYVNNRKKTYNTKLTPVIKCCIRNHAIKNETIKRKSLIRHIKKTYNTKISEGTIYNCLRKMNISRKKIRKREILRTPTKKEINIFQKKIKKTKMDDIISIDETSIDTHLSNDYGWSKKGKRIIKKYKKLRKRFTLILAVSNKKIIHSLLIKGSAKKEQFKKFLIGLLKKVDNKKLLLDNASIHRATEIRNLIANSNCEFIYNVPYSPQYNPIEKVFSKLKFLVKQENLYNKNLQQMEQTIQKKYKWITKNNLSNFYKKSLTFN